MDGHLYIVDSNGCIERVDLAEGSVSAVLADDVTGDSNLDLIVSTFTELYCLGTQTRFESVQMAWTSMFGGRNQFSSPVHEAVAISPESKRNAEIVRSELTLEVDVIHVERNPGKANATHNYNLVVKNGSHILTQMRVQTPGRYQVKVDLPWSTQGSTSATMGTRLTVELTNEFGQLYTDHIQVFINHRAHRLIKWLIILPFVGAVIATHRLLKKRRDTHSLT